MKYLFYLDDNNQLQSVKSGDTPWPRDLGITKLNIRVACYSQLTAITIAKNGFEGICVYYQTKGRDAAIEMCGYSTKNRCWVKGPPDLTPNPPPPAPPPRVIDPPLFGTSMTAVPARDGLRVLSGNDLPVVYLQWDDLALAHSQDSRKSRSSPYDPLLNFHRIFESVCPPTNKDSTYRGPTNPKPWPSLRSAYQSYGRR